MSRNIALALAALSLGSCGRADEGPAFELTYRVPAGQGGMVREVFARRLQAWGLKSARVTVAGEDRVVVRLPAAHAEASRKVKRLLQAGGRLALHASAPGDVQAKFDEDRQVPEGYRVLEDTGTGAGPGLGAKMLVKEPPIVTQRNLVRSEPATQMVPGGVAWVTRFKLDEAGAKSFDAAAKDLYRRSPPGMIAIVLDERLVSAPVVQTDSFGGEGHITGAKSQEEAQSLSIILGSGGLPAPVELESEGPAVPRK